LSTRQSGRQSRRRWLQVPVSIGDQFAATLEWETEVRGRYEIVVPPQLIVMSWDFNDDSIPLPGRPLTGYLRVHPDGDGSRVVVHHVVNSSDRATFMEGAWAMVLGRLKANILSPLARSAPPPRQRRHKTITNAAVGTRLTDGPNGRSNARRWLVC
jgi:hypothetical protein